MNTHRGEVILHYGGQALCLRPTFAALAEIEGELNTGIIALAKRMATGDATQRDMLAVLQAGLRATATSAPKPDVLFQDLGLALIQENCLQFLLNALSGAQNSQQLSE